LFEFFATKRYVFVFWWIAFRISSISYTRSRIILTFRFSILVHITFATLPWLILITDRWMLLLGFFISCRRSRLIVIVIIDVILFRQSQFWNLMWPSLVIVSILVTLLRRVWLQVLLVKSGVCSLCRISCHSGAL
jgi:hypothetical protein